jgi:hypothetical protein
VIELGEKANEEGWSPTIETEGACAAAAEEVSTIRPADTAAACPAPLGLGFLAWGVPAPLVPPAAIGAPPDWGAGCGWAGEDCAAATAGAPSVLAGVA